MVKFTHELNGKLLDMSFCVSTSNAVGCGYHRPCEKKTLPNIENKKVLQAEITELHRGPDYLLQFK